ncbi:hypothetical protein [Endozoicomonas sp.]|uniref:hypothetical protein n=1 Tax=Endozoicomonas sp. TaxID=1892382 RepID=UPI002888488B|nr:hypothetical protein [Endozoicomonas sp.]
MQSVINTGHINSEMTKTLSDPGLSTPSKIHMGRSVSPVKDDEITYPPVKINKQADARSKPLLCSKDSTENINNHSDPLVLDFVKYLFDPKTETSQYADKPLKEYSISRLNAHLRNTVIYKSDNMDVPHFSEFTELFNRLNTEASRIKLKDDPVIKMIKEAELSETILTMQSDFKKKGLANFSHIMFKTPLSNILTVLRAELNRNNDEDREQFAQITLLEQDVAKLHDVDVNAPPSYREVLILSLRYALMISVFKNYPYADSDNKVNTMREINEHNYNDHEANDSFDAKLNNTLGVKPYDFHALMCRFILGYLKAIDAAEDGPDYLMLPCFDELDIDFFLKSTRYNIHPAGLLKGNIALHDDHLMRCTMLMEHDFQHILRMHKYKNHKIQESMDCSSPNQDQEILTGINNDVLENIYDKDTASSVELCIFYFTHENLFYPYNSLPLSFLKSKGFSSDVFDKKGLVTTIVSGYFEFDEGCTIKHVKQACELLNAHCSTEQEKNKKEE